MTLVGRTPYLSTRPPYPGMWVPNDMSKNNSEDFGGVEHDLEGQMATRKVQKGGRLNFPDEYLKSIGVEKSDRVFILVQDGSLKVMKADAKNLAATGITMGMKCLFGTKGDS